MTTINIIKSFVGIGILATPYGFKLVGYFYATILLCINGFLNSYTACL
jgi:amino acid permease